MSNADCILLDGRRFDAASSASQAVRKPPIVPQALEATLEEVAKPLTTARGEDTFDAIADRPVLERSPLSKTRRTHSASSTKLENTVREQTASILALVEESVVCLFGDAGRDTESIPDTKMISVIQKLVNRAGVKLFELLPFTRRWRWPYKSVYPSPER